MSLKVMYKFVNPFQHKKMKENKIRDEDKLTLPPSLRLIIYIRMNLIVYTLD